MLGDKLTRLEFDLFSMSELKRIHWALVPQFKTNKTHEILSIIYYSLDCGLFVRHCYKKYHPKISNEVCQKTRCQIFVEWKNVYKASILMKINWRYLNTFCVICFQDYFPLYFTFLEHIAQNISRYWRQKNIRTEIDSTAVDNIRCLGAIFVDQRMMNIATKTNSGIVFPHFSPEFTVSNCPKFV